MIVKNEEHVICSTFDNLLSYIPIDYWVISDTGSTDNTKKVIQEYFQKKNIPGELVEHEWRDFGYNRTKALECAYQKSDYLFIFDADDKICGDFKIPNVLNADMYQLKFGMNFTYLRPLLINNRKRWHYKGVLHEFLASQENVNMTLIIDGEYYIESGRTGDRSKNPNKYRDDAEMLKKAFEKEEQGGDAGMIARYAFYCAQSYKDSKMFDEAIEWYKKCLDLQNWHQEKYYASLMIATMLQQKNDLENALKYFLKTVEYDAERVEGVVGAMELLQKRGDHLLVNGLYHRFKNYNQLPSKDKLFVFQNSYKDAIEYINSISSCYCNDREEGYKCCKKILLNMQLSDIQLIQTIKNLFFYKDFLQTENGKEAFKLFENVEKIMNKNKIVDDNVSNIWKMLYQKRQKIKQTMNSEDNLKNKIKIVNLERRPDRKEKMVTCLKNMNISEEKYEFIKACDGKNVEATFGIKHLFRNNDFRYNKGVIGCALSHIQLWQKLIEDPENDYYIILEDDVTMSKKTKEYLLGLQSVFSEKEVVFLGYHMYYNNRDKFGFIYNENECDVKDIKIAPLVRKLIMGGTFSYTINKLGARKFLEAVSKKGVARAIDGFMVDQPDIEIMECRPQIFFSDFFVRDVTDNIVDTDIQNSRDCLIFDENINNNKDFVFLPGIDQIGNDIERIDSKDINKLLEYAVSSQDCVAFNTLGYFKNKIEILQKVPWFSEKDGIFIKKNIFEKLQLENEKLNEMKTA